MHNKIYVTTEVAYRLHICTGFHHAVNYHRLACFSVFQYLPLCSATVLSAVWNTPFLAQLPKDEIHCDSNCMYTCFVNLTSDVQWVLEDTCVSWNM